MDCFIYYQQYTVNLAISFLLQKLGSLPLYMIMKLSHQFTKYVIEIEVLFSGGVMIAVSNSFPSHVITTDINSEMIVLKI